MQHQHKYNYQIYADNSNKMITTPNTKHIQFYETINKIIQNDVDDPAKCQSITLKSDMIMLQSNNQEFSTENYTQHKIHNSMLSSEKNTKDLLNMKNNSQINSNTTSLLANSQCNNINNNYVKSSTNKPVEQKVETIKESALHCHLNGDNNNCEIMKPQRFISIQQNGWNTKLNIITSPIEETMLPLTPPITLTSEAAAVAAAVTAASQVHKIDINNQEQHNILIVNKDNIKNQRHYIEDVHNYSKKSSNNYESSGGNHSNCTTDDYDDDSENGGYQNLQNNNHKWSKSSNNTSDEKFYKKFGETTPPPIEYDNREITRTPDHHARRPMNAFLIFCKRHRAIVRDKYKNVENRQITKILGEWWANMTKEDKSCYADLAKENKDAFLSANPSFKWYKLPAPPLRTLLTRPQPATETIFKDAGTTLITPTINSCNPPVNGPEILTDNSPTNHVGYFKFADETQMGNLNSLMSSNNSPDSSNHKFINSANNFNIVAETSELLQIPTDCCNEPFENMRDHATKMENNSKITDINGIKRKLNNNNENDSINHKKFKRDLSFSSSGEDDSQLNRKNSRSCKGKKYQQLMNSGQILNKKSKKNHENTNRVMKIKHKNHSSSDSDYNLNNSASKIVATSNLCTNFNEKHNFNVRNDTEICNNVEFDLDSRIKALPAQCLEKYLMKKQESKSKKKIKSKRPNNLKTEIIFNKNNNEEILIDEELKEQIVGSQKRKARKESITRRDVNHLQKDVNLLRVLSNEEEDGGKHEEEHNAYEDDGGEFIPNDLLFLAEIASNVDE